MRLRRRTAATAAAEQRAAYVLVAVLIVIVVLSLAAYRFTDGMTSQYAVAARTADAAQAKTFAASGVHYAMGLLADPAAMSGTLNSNPYDNAGVFAGQPLGDSPRRGGARFSLVSVAPDGAGGYTQKYGVTDEAGKINLNAFLKIDDTGEALYKALLNLPNMTEEVADAIVDWVDADDTQRPAGAESAYYLGLSPPYQAKNGPVNSIDELLLVQGVTPQLLYGNDRNRNGLLDPDEDSSAEFGRGWSEYLTAYGHETDTTAEGFPRIFVNDPEIDAPTLYEQLQQVLPQGMADYVMAVRLWGQAALPQPTVIRFSSSSFTSNSGSSSGTSGSGSVRMTETTAKYAVTVTADNNSSSSGSKTVTGTLDDLSAAVKAALAADSPPSLNTKIKTMNDLLNTQVSLPKAADADKDAPTVVVASPLSVAENAGTMLGPLLEYTTSTDPAIGYDMTPRINVLTAPTPVLLAVPGMTQEDADAVVAARSGLDPADPATTTGAFLVTAAKMPPTKFAAMAPYVTGRTMVYRVHSVGHFAQGGPVARVEAVIDTNGGTPRIVSYRDVSDLGPGFQLPAE